MFYTFIEDAFIATEFNSNIMYGCFKNVTAVIYCFQGC